MNLFGFHALLGEVATRQSLGGNGEVSRAQDVSHAGRGDGDGSGEDVSSFAALLEGAIHSPPPKPEPATGVANFAVARGVDLGGKSQEGEVALRLAPSVGQDATEPDALARRTTAGGRGESTTTHDTTGRVPASAYPRGETAGGEGLRFPVDGARVISTLLGDQAPVDVRSAGLRHEAIPASANNPLASPPTTSEAADLGAGGDRPGATVERESNSNFDQPEASPSLAKANRAGSTAGTEQNSRFPERVQLSDTLSAEPEVGAEPDTFSVTREPVGRVDTVRLDESQRGLLREPVVMTPRQAHAHNSLTSPPVYAHREDSPPLATRFRGTAESPLPTLGQSGWPDVAPTAPRFLARSEPGSPAPEQASRTDTAAAAPPESIRRPSVSAADVDARGLTLSGVLAGSGLDAEAVDMDSRTRTDPNPDRDLRRLDPRLRTVLGRVMNRLEREFGIEAQVSEGFRSADRQKTLFAQGRSAPGKVVTWTLDSAHMKGRAVDLVLNGQWSDLDPYRVLQQVAQEEGLTTLGMKDPGHLELASRPGRAAAGDGGGYDRYPEQGRSTLGTRSVLASAAPVAGVAGRAGVARTAAPAVPGRAPRRAADPMSVLKDLGTAAGKQAQPLIPETPPAIPEPRLDGSDLGTSTVTTEDVQVAASSGSDGANVSLSGASAESTEVEPEVTPTRTPTSAPAVRAGSAASPVTESSTAGRVEQVRALQDAAEAQSPRMRVDLGDVDGSGTRIRLDLREGKVGARIDVNDPVLGNNMKREMGSLRTALQSKGLETDGLHVRTMTQESASSTGVSTGSESVLQLEAESKEARERDRDSSGGARNAREDAQADRRKDGPPKRNQKREENK